MIGTSPRLRYLGIQLLLAFPNTVAIVNESPFRHATDAPESMLKHFADFESTENQYFLEYVEQNKQILEERVVKTIRADSVNNSETVEFIGKLNPRVIVMHGPGIIKPPLIKAFPQRIINLHSGLLPYYKGVGTNVFPIINGEPEYIGMSAYFIDEGIDTGPVILQGRPTIEESDDSHTIGCKNVYLGVELLTRVMTRFLDNGAIPSLVQDSQQGRCYYRKDFTLDAMAMLYKNISDGILIEYSRNPKYVDHFENFPSLTD
jgi:folate-dependent phosphoribosylglycinamide formyltransferase PurN